jgi:hypothetical protein
MPYYNTRSVTRERNATREKNTARVISKNEVNCRYFTRSKVPKMDNIKDNNKSRFNKNELRFFKTCKWFLNEIENKNTHNEKITIFNDFMEYFLVNKKILESHIKLKNVLVKKIIYIYNTCEHVGEFPNNWHFLFTGRPIKNN